MGSMNSARPRSPADRDRAIALVRRLTLGTTIAGIAAVGGFGGLAAVSSHGSAQDVTTAAITSTDTDTDTGTESPTSTATANSPSSTSAGTSDDTSSSSSSSSITSSTGSAHATTGGS